MSKYLKAVRKSNEFEWKLYMYDPTGNNEIVLERSNETFLTKAQAIDAGIEWGEARNLEFEVDFSD